MKSGRVRPSWIDWIRPEAVPAIVSYSAIALRHRGVLPVWDAWFYTNCLTPGVGRGLARSAWMCANHPTGGYFAWLAAAYRLSGLSYSAVVASNVLFGILAILAISTLANRALPGDGNRIARALVALAVGLNPIFLLATVHLTPDFGVTVFSSVVLAAFAARRPAAAVVAGLLLAFSKETGIPIYASAVVAYGITHVLRDAGDEGRALMALRKNAWLLAPPIVAVSAIVGRALALGGGGSWSGRGAHVSPWRHLLTINFVDNVLLTQLAQVFVFNFAWVVLPFIVAALARATLSGLLRWSVGSARPAPQSEVDRTRYLIAIAFGLTVWSVVRFPTWLIARYVLPAVALVPLVGCLSMDTLGVRRVMRDLLLAALVVCSAASIYRTRDGVTTTLFGTFEFGSHRMVLVGAPARLAGGGEQNHYNLELLNIGLLLRQAMPTLLRDGNHTLAMHDSEFPDVLGWVDAGTHQVGSFGPRAMVPAVVHLREIQHGERAPERVYYLEMPGREDEDELIGWSVRYDLIRSLRFERDGYVMMVRDLRLRSATPH